jgi:putative transposase
MFASDIKRKRIQSLRAHSNWKWHLDEEFVKVNSQTHYLWRAVNCEGEVLESVVTKTRDRRAALKLLRKLMKNYANPETIVTDKLTSYSAALRELSVSGHENQGRWINNRAENSHQPFRRRERAMQRFRLMRSLQKFASIHASVYNQPLDVASLVCRPTLQQGTPSI